MNLKSDFSGVKKAVISLSGGLDSTTLLHLAVKELGAKNVHALSFKYGQRHNIELDMAVENCKLLGIAEHKIIDISFLGEIVKGVSAMVDGDVPTPKMGDLDAEKVVPTYVPFRNSILSSITLAYAEAVGADCVALGVQFGDYSNSDRYYYWDCSAEFTKTMQHLASLNDKHKIEYRAPFVNLTKKDEITLGRHLGVDYSKTWTCYSKNITKTEVRYESEPAGGKNPVTYEFWEPCGTCPSCAGRLESFKALGIEDPQKGVWKKK